MMGKAEVGAKVAVATGMATAMAGTKGKARARGGVGAEVAATAGTKGRARARGGVGAGVAAVVVAGMAAGVERPGA